jgi:hypothetical protein
MRPGFLNENSLRLLFTPNKTNSGEPTRYGLGWFVVNGLVFHGGDSAGGAALLMAHPASRTVAAFAANTGNVLLRNSVRRGKTPKEAEQYMIKKEAVVAKILSTFVE